MITTDMDNYKKLEICARGKMIAENIQDFSDAELNRVFNEDVIFYEKGIEIVKKLIENGLTIAKLYEEIESLKVKK